MSEVFDNQQIDDWEYILSKELDSQSAPMLAGDAKRFIATIRALQRLVEWTKDCPKEEGYYWMKDGSAEAIVHVCIGEFDGFHYENVEQFGLRKPTELSKFTGMLWAGPIPAPHEARG